MTLHEKDLLDEQSTSLDCSLTIGKSHIQNHARGNGVFKRLTCSWLSKSFKQSLRISSAPSLEVHTSVPLPAVRRD